MKTELRPIIIGAGGVASYLLPALANSFELKGILFDGDLLEEHNLDRQLFDKKHIGRSKVDSILRKWGLTRNLEPIQSYFHSGKLEEYAKAFQKLEPDCIICLVDNHPARVESLLASEALNIPCFIGANEYATSQAHVFHPVMVGKRADPRIRYPELLTDESGSPINCTGIAQESEPQLAIANQVTAALVNWLIYLWSVQVEDYSSIPSHTPIEIQTTFGKVETLTYGDNVK